MQAHSNARTQWHWPVELERYDRSPELSAAEQQALSYVTTRHTGQSAGPWPKPTALALRRLVQPLRDVLAVTAGDAHSKQHAVRVLMIEMHQRGRAYWGWSDEQWLETVGVTAKQFIQRQTTTVVTHRQPVFTIAYLLGGFRAFDGFAPHGIELACLADSVFGRATMAAALDRLLTVLIASGYHPSIRGKVYTALAYAFLINGSARLEDLTAPLLTSLVERRQTTFGLPQLYAISCALAQLRIIAEPIPRGQSRLSLLERVDCSGIASAWVDWSLAWYRQAVGSPMSKKNHLFALLQIGRWLAQCHPTIKSPEDWDYATAADFVTAVDQKKVGDWRSASNYPDYFKREDGKPLAPRAKVQLLLKARSFFSDLQDYPHRVGDDPTPRLLPRRFNVIRALRTPPGIFRLIGPEPRVIDERLWLKLIYCAERLERDDLKQAQLAMYPFELVHAVAVVWCLSGLRGDEIRRLRVGCIRWRIEDGIDSAPNDALPEDALCFLSVPVNKTATAFVKPVHWLVGKKIEAWERVRPPQAPALDPKTNEKVDFLFSVRGIKISRDYLNGHLIPLLCAKANIPIKDTIGKITAHRARTSMASALYNAPEGLSIGELGQWLGHKDLRSTQHYAKLHPTRLAESVARANKNSRLARVLVDTNAAVRGEPAIFYYLGEHAYCANPAWASCPHRMACLKCPMYVPQNVGRLIEARDGVLQLMQEIPLTAEEKAVAEGDVQALNRYIEKRTAVAPPPVPDPRYIFNRSQAKASSQESPPVDSDLIDTALTR